MRFHYYVALVAASALYTSTDGLQAVPSSAVSTSLRGTTNSIQKPTVESKMNRFLIAEYDNALDAHAHDVNTLAAKGEEKRFLKSRSKRKRRIKIKHDEGDSDKKDPDDSDDVDDSSD